VFELSAIPIKEEKLVEIWMPASSIYWGNETSWFFDSSYELEELLVVPSLVLIGQIVFIWLTTENCPLLFKAYVTL
jgi:hypothetical protein